MNLIEFIKSLILYFIDNQVQILALLLEHIKLTALSVSLSILIGVPIGILICYIRKLSKPILGVASIVQAIPSMALLGFAIPLFGIGTLPAVIIVILYSLLPIIKNTYTGLSGINKQTIEAAKGIGLTKVQILFQVQIPLALPIIMAGVRISAVTAVGLMTMAAFIGAGGLGVLVFAGLRTVNNYQILAGAIPACLLALAVDALIALVEKLVTPISLQKATGQSLGEAKRTRRKQQGFLGVSTLLVLVLMFISAVPNGAATEKVIRIGSKDYTEQIIVGNLVKKIVEDRSDIKVEHVEALSGTKVCFDSLNSGEIDMYVEYTGTAFGNLLNHPPSSDVDLVYDTVKEEFKEQYDIEVFPPMNFNNTYTLAIKPELSQKYNIKSISDLAKYADQLTICCNIEFANREDALLGLKRKYNFDFRKTLTIDGSPRYTSLINNNADVVDAFATDGLIRKFDLVVLEDDKKFFAPYFAVPIVRAEIAEKYPELKIILDELGQVLTDDVMTELNYQVDELQKQPDVVAHEFLVDNGLISN